MSRSRVRTRTSAWLSAFVCLSLIPGPVMAQGPGPEPPIEGPQPEPTQSEPETSTEPPAPNLAPVLIPGQESPGIEFAVPPPEGEPEPVPQEPSLAAQFPDPGVAPNDGRNMLVLGGTAIALTIVAFSAGLTIGLQEGTELKWLLPSTIVPAVGVLAFAGGGLYLGIKRAAAHRRWAIGYRVIGLPQGGGLMVGGSFTLLGALGLIPSGVLLWRTNGQVELGATMVAVGAASAIATPIMFVIGARNQRRYQQTGGWKRKPIPPLPPGAATSRLELQPLVLPLYGGASVGASGRF